MLTMKAQLGVLAAACLGIAPALDVFAAGPSPGVNVTVTNPPTDPVAVAVTNPLQVTITNPTTLQNVVLSNIPVRFEPSGTDIFGISLIAQDVVPPGHVFILTYASAVGRPNHSAAVITAAECQLMLRHTQGSDILEFTGVPLPMKASGLGAASGSEPMYLPIKTGEGVSARCAASGVEGGSVSSLAASWNVVLGGYFTPTE
jgi:hypothetical protein